MSHQTHLVTDWACHVCEKLRPDKFISVLTTDVSIKNGFQFGVVKQNVRYCNDDDSCVAGAKLLNWFTLE